MRYFSLAVLFNKHNISLVTDAEVKNYNTRGKKRKQSDINESEIHKRKQKQNSNNGNKKKKLTKKMIQAITANLTLLMLMRNKTNKLQVQKKR